MSVPESIDVGVPCPDGLHVVLLYRTQVSGAEPGPDGVNDCFDANGSVREAPRRRPGGGACGGHGVLRDEPVREVELVGDRAALIGGDVDVSTPCLARVVIHANVDGLARRPVSARKSDLLARGVVGLVGPHRRRRRCLDRRPPAIRQRKGREHQPREERQGDNPPPVCAALFLSPQLSRLYSSPSPPVGGLVHYATVETKTCARSGDRPMVKVSVAAS